MFSIIVPTCRGIDALKPLFLTSNSETEIIIIDSNYNDETKEQLRQIKHSFSKVTYAPPKQREEKKPFDLISAINTGIAYSEEPWIIKIDDNWELKPDFFKTAEEDIEHFSKTYGKHFIIRPLELEPWMNDTKWNSFIPEKQRYFRLPHPPLGRSIPIQTIGQALYHITAMYDLNGWDERYDQGLGWNDNDMFYRFLVADYPIFLDQQLMIYRYHHQSTGTQEKRNTAMQQFQNNIEQIKKGKYRAPNPFNLEDLHKKQLRDKHRYIV